MRTDDLVFTAILTVGFVVSVVLLIGQLLEREWARALQLAGHACVCWLALSYLSRAQRAERQLG